MKKVYEEPKILLMEGNEEDIISTSAGDTPNVNPFEW